MSEHREEWRTTMDRLDLVQRQVGEIGVIVYAGPLWLQRNYTEPRVLCALQDLVRPGRTVFDVGANFGHLSVAMSRRAGPRGAVCAFEANPEIARRCQAMLVQSGCGNSQVFSAAIHHTSHQRLPLYLSDNMVADSITRKVSDRSIEVRTIALDDFVAETGLIPDLVKMDIEGAEFDALVGFRRTIEEHHPILILEQQPDDDRCFRFLQERGYEALDLSNYRSVDSFVAIPAGVVVTDMLYARPDRIAGTPYAGPLEPVVDVELGEKDFAWTSDAMYQTPEPIGLEVGRYLIEIEFTADAEIEVKCGVAIAGVPVMQHHGFASWLTKLARCWVVALESEGPATLFFQFPQQRDPTLRVARAVVSRLPSFDGRAPLFL